MIHHGGKLLEAIGVYGGSKEEWVDVSTGVSPYTYPVTSIPLEAWNRLPEDNDGLEIAAQSYYNSRITPVAIAGSQAAIMLLPLIVTEHLGRCGTICLPSVGYKEHQHAWQKLRHNNQMWDLDFYDDIPSDEQVKRADVILIINPNNPTGYFIDQQTMHRLQQQLHAKGGRLIVDEAFMDCTPEKSILPTFNTQSKLDENLIVLRSVGKFFGLAGARVGFVFAVSPILQKLREEIGPWTVTGPARWVVNQALQDGTWQQQTRQQLKTDITRLESLISNAWRCHYTSGNLFVTAYLNNAEITHQTMCKNQVLARLCDENNAIRFGLPKQDWQWDRLEQVLKYVFADLHFDPNSSSYQSNRSSSLS
ncbi:threonine-phosphate decarboxylase [Vibrio maerlii]|uniref:threonine-phosphate decarboxylase n=1 Tax=Vibrio maerlii TaxID=2231648 RepID=UPI000E3CBD14|nr:threonine-phosphate decarboxylase [Vibrio maerlii]